MSLVLGAVEEPISIVKNVGMVGLKTKKDLALTSMNASKIQHHAVMTSTA